MRAARVLDGLDEVGALSVVPASRLAELSHVRTAGAILAERRRLGLRGPSLPEALRPVSLWHALAIQSSVIEHMGEAIAGWKCGTPGPGKLVVAPMFAGSTHQGSTRQGGGCPVWAGPAPEADDVPEAMASLPWVKIEPELAFVIGEDLPPRELPYTAQDVDAAIKATHLALELIDSRYDADADLSFADKLADGLVNQGLFLGPQVDSEAARQASTMQITLRADGQPWRTFEGRHPDDVPRLPLYWLADYLRGHGQGLRAGQVVITGSYAGSFMVPVGPELAVAFGALGELAVRFKAKLRSS